MGSEQDQYRKARSEKAAFLRELGHDPFGSRFEPSCTVLEARGMVPEPVPGDEQPRGGQVRVAGRIGNIRKAGGKLVFATLYDRSRGDAWLQQQVAGQDDLDGAERKKERGIQLYLERGALGDERWPLVRKGLDLADWIGVTGRVGRTRTGEASIFVEEVQVLGKSLLPPPQQAGASSGLLSPEMRQRHREVDLLMSDASLAAFMLRSRLVSAVRGFFVERGFLEVETPMMHPVLGGAAARPFVTHHNALERDLYLRIAPELYLKRLLVGGLERVFELNRNFRNEGLSPRHNPEFTMIEWYQAYADHHQMMDLTEDLFRHLADRLFGTRRLRLGSQTVDLDRPFRRLAYRDALRELGGLDYDDQVAVRARAKGLGLEPGDFATYDRLVNEVWEAVVEPHLIVPTFITDQPAWLTPLCRTWPDRPEQSMRFELFIDRMEVGNAYSELNDPDVQLARFQEQLREAQAAGDDEAGIDGLIDQDYVRALEHGLPVCGGQGIGIDRLVMLFTGCDSIRDVILFPALRPEGAQPG
ncbi:MAG: lysine--tRNA ligase [Planctomycetota bacterium]